MSLSGELMAAAHLLLDVVPTPTGAGSGAQPQGSYGFAAYLVGGFVGLGVIVLAMILLSLKPKRADPDGDRR